MKKWALLLALVLGLLTGFSAVSSPRAKSESSAPATFVLPSSLVSIDEEAFAGTAAESVELPDSLTTVGERAFADMPRLRTMSVPASVTFIGEQAFAGVTGLTILAPEGSYAERWAEAHSIACTQCETAVSRLQQLGKLLCHCLAECAWRLEALSLHAAVSQGIQHEIADTLLIFKHIYHTNKQEM